MKYTRDVAPVAYRHQPILSTRAYECQFTNDPKHPSVEMVQTDPHIHNPLNLSESLNTQTVALTMMSTLKQTRDTSRHRSGQVRDVTILLFDPSAKPNRQCQQ